MSRPGEQSKVLFHAGPSSVCPGTEKMWGTILGENLFELDNIPAIVSDISLGDVFEAYHHAATGLLEFFRVVRRSSNATYRFDFRHSTVSSSQWTDRLREHCSPRELLSPKDDYLSMNVSANHDAHAFREMCVDLNRANVLVGCSSEPSTPLLRNEDSPADAIACYHVLDDRMPVLVVGRYDDGLWDINCGVSDHDVENLTKIHAWHVFARDVTLKAIFDLKPGYGSERDSVGEPWEDPIFCEEYCED